MSKAFPNQDGQDRMNARMGYRFRDELVERLLPYVKRGVDRRSLNNLTRGYVPVFFPTHLDKDRNATWLFPLSLGRRDYWWKQEIEDIGAGFANEASLDCRAVRKVFKKQEWCVEEPVRGISITDKRGRWKYDAWKMEV